MKVSYYAVGGYGANCVIVSDGNGQCVVIDPGDDAERLWAILTELGDTVTAILLTHAHFDHMLAVRELQEKTGAPLYVHAAEAGALTNAARSLIPPHRFPYPLTADRFLEDGDTVQVGETALTVLHTPGHTPGSCCYYGDGVLIAGDTLFAGSIGRTDFYGGSMTEMRNSLRRLNTLPTNTRVIAGHGEETTIGYEQRYNPYLAGV